MGYMTVVTVLNDAFPTLEANKDEFLRNIENGGRGDLFYHTKAVNDYGVGNHANPMQVAKSFHSSQSHLFYVGQNLMTMLTDDTETDKNRLKLQLDRIKKAKKMLSEMEAMINEKLEE